MEEKLKYRYFLTGRTGTRQVHPVNGSKLSLNYSKEKDKLDYTSKISDRLKLIGEDFLWVFVLEKTIYRCDYLSLSIEKYCGTAWTPFFDGRISLNSGDPWNLDKGFVELGLEDTSDYACIEDFGETDYNLFNYISHSQSVNPITGTLENNNVYATSDPSTGIIDLFPGELDPYSKGWVQQQIGYQYSYTYPSGYPISDPNNYNVYITWVRETITVPVATILDSSWTEISNDGTNHTYARPPILYNPVNGGYNPSAPDDYSVSYSILETNIDNGASLFDAVTVLLQLTCPQLTLESDFFQWNPVTPTNINYVTGQTSKVKNLKLFQKSDVKRPNVSDNATIATANFKALIADLCNMFQLEYEVTSNNKFKLEHISFYEGLGVGIDTTIPELARFTAGNRAYSYDNDGIPKNETFQFMDKSYGDFAGANIVYTSSCAGQGDTKDIAYNVENITTDVQLCLNNPLADSSVSDDGFVLIACDVANSIIREAGILGGNVINNSLAWAQLQRDYWRHNRAQKTFLMSNTLTTAQSVKPSKVQIDFVIPYCCEVFDPKLFVKSSLGSFGTIKTAKYDLYNEKLTLSLAHPADDGLLDNNAPTVIGDSASTFVNYAVTIDVLANDYDSDGVINPGTLAILGGPSQGTAVITPDFKVLYTPNTGYTGSDVFVYSVKDNFGEVSANTLVTITVNAGSPVLIANDDAFTIAKDKALYQSAPGVLANDTAPSAITAVAITKATTGGGSVTIHTDGSFIYTPLTGFIGVDTFTYTAQDVSLATRTATVSITVFTPSPVYVALREGGMMFPVSIIETCSGMATVVGEHKLNDYYLDFFSDPSFSIPLDVTHYALVISVDYAFTDNTTGITTHSTNTFVATGTTMQIETNYETEYQYTGCSALSNINQSTLLSLLPGTDYNI